LFTSFALLAMGVIIVKEYFVWKSKYYFGYSLLPLQHITAHSVQLSSVGKHLMCSKFIFKTLWITCLPCLNIDLFLRHNVHLNVSKWLYDCMKKHRICNKWYNSPPDLIKDVLVTFLSKCVTLNSKNTGKLFFPSEDKLYLILCLNVFLWKCLQIIYISHFSIRSKTPVG
jgi:hypothetical protein